MMDMYMCTAV